MQNLHVYSLVSKTGVVTFDLPSGHWKTCFGLEPVPKCEPSIYQPPDQQLGNYATSPRAGIEANTCPLAPGE